MSQSTRPTDGSPSTSCGARPRVGRGRPPGRGKVSFASKINLGEVLRGGEVLHRMASIPPAEGRPSDPDVLDHPAAQRLVGQRTVAGPQVLRQVRGIGGGW